MGGSRVQGACPCPDSLQFVLSYKRLEAGTFKLVRAPEGGANHIEIDAVELSLMLEGIDLAGAKRRKRYRHEVPQAELSQ